MPEMEPPGGGATIQNRKFAVGVKLILFFLSLLISVNRSQGNRD